MGQVAFESRALIQGVRSNPDFEAVLTLLRQSSVEELKVTSPATDASILFYAVQRQNDEQAEALCRVLCEELAVCDPRQADRNLQTALFFAARDGNARCVTYLVQQGCDPNHRDSAVQTAIFYAARDGRTAAVQALLAAGAQVNAVDHLGQTALFYASRDGRTDTVALMLGHGAAINIKDRHRRTALFYAQKNSHKELAALLKAAGGSAASPPPLQRQGSVEILSEAAATPGASSSAAAATPPVTEVVEAGAVSVKRARVGSGGIATSIEEETAATAAPPSSAPAASSGPPTSAAAGAMSAVSTVPMQRRCYRLMIKGPSDDPQIAWLAAPLEQIQLFESLAPQIAVWSQTATTPVTDILHSLKAAWQATALSILDVLSGLEGGWVFSKPVDCKAWGCPDYYEVIKEPMDYQTIKRKIKTNAYRLSREFCHDMDLVFSNCFRYNKPESPVATIGRNIERQYHNLLEEKQFKLWEEREAQVVTWQESKRVTGSDLMLDSSSSVVFPSQEASRASVLTASIDGSMSDSALTNNLVPAVP